MTQTLGSEPGACPKPIAVPIPDGIRMTWGLPLDTGGLPITSYSASYKEFGGDWIITATGLPSQPRYYDFLDIENLDPQTTYQVSVRPANDVGFGPWSPPSDLTYAGPPTLSGGGGITDRIRFTVIEMNTNKILTRDLVVMEPQVMAALSGPAQVNFKIPQAEQFSSSWGIEWKCWGQWVVVEMEIANVRRIVACTITNDVKIDPESGALVVESLGFSDYPRGLPWLENWNDIAVDPFEVVERIWNHVQSFPNAQLNVEVHPVESGTQMLPGYGFDGSILNFDFFALFIRSVDFTDCGDFISGLSRDLPFDYIEKAEWNADRTEVSRTLELAYPKRGIQRTEHSFRMGENVLSAELAEEKDIEHADDVIIRGWFPGKVYDARVSNFDMTRARRTVIEEDAKINSTERAVAWAHRKLQRRIVPRYWSKVIIDPNHPHGPFGSWELGDSIWIKGEYPWIGEVAQWHRIMAWSYDEAAGRMELSCKVEGAFNYDPIEYDPNIADNPREDPNLLYNGYFDSNLAGWSALQGQWIRVISDGYTEPGCVRIDCDDAGEKFLSQKIGILGGQRFRVEGMVRWDNIECVAPDVPSIILKGITYYQGLEIGEVDFDTLTGVEVVGNHAWFRLFEQEWTCPLLGAPETIDQIAIQLTITDNVIDGTAWWDDIRIMRYKDAPS